jgi:mRNA-degrading endonuclease toxin of MazEF toxin-antitoxin module
MMSSERTEGPPAALFARGDIVTIADRDVEFAGKPRPALVLQSPHFVTMTLTVCLITSIAVDAPLLRIALPVNEANGLVVPSCANRQNNNDQSAPDRPPHRPSRQCETV